MLLPEHIAADRLVLRRPRREDAPAVAEAIAESLKELAGWFQWAQLLQRFADPEDMGDRATVANLRFDDLHNPVYFIWEGDRLQGEVILDNPLWEEERALEMEVWLRRPAWGRGLATEAARAALRHVFEVERCQLVEARIESRNRASRALFTRLGFQRYGFRRDHERFALSAEDWAADHGEAPRHLGVVVLSHPECLLHPVSPDHPDQPERLQAVLDAARELDLTMLGAPRADERTVALVHPDDHVDVLRARTADAAALDRDTDAGPGSVDAALRGVGGAVAGVDLVLAGHADHVFVATRPPGHHASRTRPMGFCLFSSVAIAALHARYRAGAERVAVLDFDVHQGNGTQDALSGEPGVLFISVHEELLYPLTGRQPPGAPNVVNIGLAPRTDSAAFRAIFAQKVLPRLQDFAPDVLLLSAGFDAHAADPVSTASLQSADFGWLAEQLRAVAPTVSVLEGGYDTVSLKKSAKAFLRAMVMK